MIDLGPDLGMTCKPCLYMHGTIRYSMHLSTGEPTNLAEALSNNNWKKAMDIEFAVLTRNKTCHLVPPQKGNNVINCKWVFKVNGSLDHY
jgi:hypothetical protein